MFPPFEILDKCKWGSKFEKPCHKQVQINMMGPTLLKSTKT